MSQRLAQAAARVHELARALVASAEAARQEATALERAIAERRRAPEPPPVARPAPHIPRPPARPPAVTSPPNGALPGDIDAARLIAIELADGGSSREEVERHLRARFGGLPGDGLEGVLDDVFGPASRAG
jgi:hypothetical protein